MLVIVSIDLVVCGAAVKRATYGHIVIISGISALMFFIAICAGKIAMAGVSPTVASGAGGLIFFGLGSWAFYSARKQPQEFAENISGAKALLIGIAAGTDAFIAGIGAGIYGVSPSWSLLLWVIGITFFQGGQLFGRVLEGRSLTYAQGILFYVLGLIQFI